jgi:hypothetical protein
MNPLIGTGTNTFLFQDSESRLGGTRMKRYDPPVYTGAQGVASNATATFDGGESKNCVRKLAVFYQKGGETK